jgi:acetyl esterase
MADTEHYVRDDVRGFLTMLEQMGGPQMDEIPIDQARGAYVAMATLAEAEPRELAVVRDLTCPGPAGEIPLRLYDAREHRTAGPVVMFFHGGGFTIGDLDTHNAFCTELAAELDLPVVAVHYRLAPEAPFPAAPEDCEAATRWAASNPHELGREVTGIITTGDSAGGNLSIVIAQALSDRPAEVPVILQAPIYPIASPVEETSSFKSFAEGFLLTARTMTFFSDSYAADPQDKRNYPILHDNHAASPPTVLITAGLDPLRDSGREYAAHLIQNGVDVIYLEARGNVHGFVTIRKAVPSAQGDVAALVAAIKLMLERHS